MTIADLARDGILTVTMIGKSASARLTPRGVWFARTLAAEFAAFNGNLTCDLVGHRSGNVPSLTGGANATGGASKAST